LITVYLRAGQHAEIHDAQTVEVGHQFVDSKATTAILACKDTTGKTIAEFFSDAVAGYSVTERL
jgi:hypothetical protein